jgi:acyl transferase domain-containing protein/acyl carrier protein
MSETQPDSPQGIAIVGLSARFPGSGDVDAFWRNLRDGVESITFFTEEELAGAGVDPLQLADDRYVRAKAVLDGADLFDPAFFGFTPREAEYMDPQHRIFLECAWEAFEDAGYDPGRLSSQGAGRAGVFAGTGESTYMILNLLPHEELLAKMGALQAILLNDRDFLSTRVSYKLDLKGPSVTVQTACSTSLVAIHMAAQSLLAGECDMALAGGVSISVPLLGGYTYQEGGVLSPDGHCRAFDAEAGGSVVGNGAGAVILKRLADALEDGDHVYAVILGSAINNDGSSKVGFTAPSVTGQAEAISESLLMAGVEADTIGYIETHGSGTPLGDPIEMEALNQAFRAVTEEKRFCAIGSIKTNVGHCNTAAGVAGFMKTVLSLHHRTVVPSLNFRQPNPQIDFADSPFYVSTATTPWKRGEAPRRAGVSSFGLGGTNAHAVLEEAPEPPSSEPSRRPWQLLPVSARSAGALDIAAERLAKHLESHPDLALADVAFTLQMGRKGFDQRRAVLARDASDAVAALRDPKRWIAGVREGAAAAGGRPVVFLFPGLGDQYVDMARELYELEPDFRDAFDEVCDLLAPEMGLDLREVVFSAGPAQAASGSQGPDLRAMLRRDTPAADSAAARLAETSVAQPACFAVEYALARLLMDWGVRPQAMIGYSIGEYVAACLSGVLALADAARLVARRAKLIAGLPGGAMLAVPLAEEEVRPLLSEVDAGLSISATNGPHFCVVGGTPEAVAALEKRLAEKGAACIQLQTTHAFHSAMMEPAVAAFTERVGETETAEPQIPYLSNVTGTWVTAADVADPAYWARHMRGTVRFAEGVAELLQKPERVYLEVGPGGTLGTLVKQHPAAGSGVVTAAALRRGSEGRSDVEVLFEAVARLWTVGAEVDWAGVSSHERRRRVRLPTYPFERVRCWIDPPKAGQRLAAAAGGVAPGAVHATRRADLADWFYTPVWRQSSPVTRVYHGPNGAPLGGGWLLFLDEAGLGDRLAARLRARGEEVWTVRQGAEGGGFREEGEQAFAVEPAHKDGYVQLVKRLRESREGQQLPARMLHLWSVTPDGPEPSFAAAQAAGLYSLVFLEQALTESGADHSPIRIGVVSNHLHEVVDGDRAEPAKATLFAACKVIHQESSRLTCLGVDVTLPQNDKEAERLADQLLAEMEPAPDAPAEPAVAYRGRLRWVRTFEEVALPAEAAHASRLREGGSYLVTDGVHGVGPAITAFLAGPQNARVAVAVAPDFPPREQWESWPQAPAGPAPAGLPGGQAPDPVAAAVKRLLALEKTAGDRLLVVRADMADRAGVRQAFEQARARFGALHGVFHTGGTFMGGLIQLKNREGLDASLGPVVRGAEALLAEAREQQPGLDFVVLSSSTLAMTGGLGQLDLAASGAWLDALALRQEHDGGPFTVVVHWDPYHWDSWLAGGVGPVTGVQAEEAQKDLEENVVASGDSAEALRRLLGATLPRVVVSARDLQDLIVQTDAFTTEAFLAQMAKAHPGGTHSRAGLSTEYAEPGSELEEKVATIWQELFGIDRIGVQDNFLELGGHSLLAIQLITQVRNIFGVDLPVTVLFESPTIAELAKAITEAQGEEESPEDLEALLAMVEGLSPEEAMQRMSDAMGEEAHGG